MYSLNKDIFCLFQLDSGIFWLESSGIHRIWLESVEEWKVLHFPISIFESVLLDPNNSEQAIGNSEHQGWPWGAQQ